MEKQKRPKRLLKKSDLASATGFRATTIGYYSELGLLPFESRGRNYGRFYDLEASRRRLKKIKKMRDNGKSIPDVIRTLTEENEL